MYLLCFSLTYFYYLSVLFFLLPTMTIARLHLSFSADKCLPSQDVLTYNQLLTLWGIPYSKCLSSAFNSSLALCRTQTPSTISKMFLFFSFQSSQLYLIFSPVYSFYFPIGYSSLLSSSTISFSASICFFLLFCFLSVPRLHCLLQLLMVVSLFSSRVKTLDSMSHIHTSLDCVMSQAL